MQLKLTPEEMGEHLDTFLGIDAELDANALATATAKDALDELKGERKSLLDRRNKLSYEIRNPSMPLFTGKPDGGKGKGKGPKGPKGPAEGPDDGDDKGGGGKGPDTPPKAPDGPPGGAPVDLPEVPADVVAVQTLTALDAPTVAPQPALPAPETKSPLARVMTPEEYHRPEPAAEPVKAPRKPRKPKGQAAEAADTPADELAYAIDAVRAPREPYTGPDVLAEAEKAIEAARPRRGPVKLPRTGDDGK